jgi:hypothetical protein|tara:strand:+ start:12058 stop:13476 length:1419 start_codon:yes stop_codon:yes gene_type:complete
MTHHLSLEFDETLYSWLVSQVLLMGKPSLRSVLTDFGVPHRQLASLFPSYLPIISAITGVETCQLLSHHTALPLFKIFSDTSTYRMAVDSLLHGNAGNLHTRLSLIANRVGNTPSLSFCKVCIEDDLKFRGRAWWHMQHQLPGTNICLRHNVYLNTVSVNRNAMLLPNHVNGNPIVNSNNIDEYLSQIIYQVWSENGASVMTQDFEDYYRPRLLELGYAANLRSIRQIELRTCMQSFWRPCSNVTVQKILDDACYPSSLFRYKHANFHPLKHLLFIGFLWGSWEDFLQASVDKGLNIEKPRTRDLQYGYQNKITAIISMLIEGKSLRFIAERFTTSVATIKKIAIHNNIHINSRAQRIFAPEQNTIINFLILGKKTEWIAEKCHCSKGSVEQLLSQNPHVVESRKLKRFEILKDKHRRSLLDAINKHEFNTRGQVQKHVRASYTWLFKNDKTWLYKILPAPIPRAERYKGNF